MKRRFGFVIGACMFIGLIDLVTEQVVFATIYNPLDPSEEIVPTDPPEEVPEKVNEPPAEKKNQKSNQLLNPKRFRRKSRSNPYLQKVIFWTNRNTLDNESC